MDYSMDEEVCNDTKYRYEVKVAMEKDRVKKKGFKRTD
jgi:hypothetical protein